MSKKRIELCCRCDQPTGRAGACEDSLYDDNSNGPFCEECWKIHNDELAQDQTMKNPCQDEGD